MTQARTVDPNRNAHVLAPFPNKRVEGYHTFIPAQPQPIGSLLPAEKFPQNAKPPQLFKPIRVRDVEFAHRVWVAPMCQCG